MLEPRYIVHLCHGKVHHFYQTALALASAWRWRPSQIVWVVYTDQPTFFEEVKRWEGLPLEVVPLSAERLAEWKGPAGFVHRAKVEALRHACRTLDGLLLYTDGDVVFLSDPAVLFERMKRGHLLMHTSEGRLAEEQHLLFSKLVRFAPRARQIGIPLYPETQVWNAGVIGMPAREKDFLEKVLEWTDSLYKAYPSHVMEQLAFSLVFAETGRLVAADEVILHYWNFRGFGKWLQRNLGPGVPSPHRLLEVAPPEKVPYWRERYLRHRSLPRWRRLWQYLEGWHWEKTEGLQDQ